MFKLSDQAHQLLLGTCLVQGRPTLVLDQDADVRQRLALKQMEQEQVIERQDQALVLTDIGISYLHALLINRGELRGINALLDAEDQENKQRADDQARRDVAQAQREAEQRTELALARLADIGVQIPDDVNNESTFVLTLEQIGLLTQQFAPTA